MTGSLQVWSAWLRKAHRPGSYFVTGLTLTGLQARFTAGRNNKLHLVSSSRRKPEDMWNQQQPSTHTEEGSAGPPGSGSGDDQQNTTALFPGPQTVHQCPSEDKWSLQPFNWRMEQTGVIHSYVWWTTLCETWQNSQVRQDTSSCEDRQLQAAHPSASTANLGFSVQR